MELHPADIWNHYSTSDYISPLSIYCICNPDNISWIENAILICDDSLDSRRWFGRVRLRGYWCPTHSAHGGTSLWTPCGCKGRMFVLVAPCQQKKIIIIKGVQDILWTSFNNISIQAQISISTSPTLPTLSSSCSWYTTHDHNMHSISTPRASFQYNFYN